MGWEEERRREIRRWRMVGEGKEAVGAGLRQRLWTTGLSLALACPDSQSLILYHLRKRVFRFFSREADFLKHKPYGCASQ